MSENPEAYRIKRICGIPKKRVGGVIGPTILNGPNLEPDANVISAGIIPEMPGELDLIGPDNSVHVHVDFKFPCTPQTRQVGFLAFLMDIPL